MINKSCFVCSAFARFSSLILEPSSFFHLLGFSGSSLRFWTFLSSSFFSSSRLYFSEIIPRLTTLDLRFFLLISTISLHVFCTGRISCFSSLVWWDSSVQFSRICSSTANCITLFWAILAQSSSVIRSYFIDMELGFAVVVDYLFKEGCLISLYQSLFSAISCILKFMPVRNGDLLSLSMT